MTGLNSAFEEEIYFDFLRDPQSVSPQWREYFEKKHGSYIIPLDYQAKKEEDKPSYYQESAQNKSDANGAAAQPAKGNSIIASGDIIEELTPIASRLAKNMEESLNVPTATSVRTIPVKALDENRRIINKYLAKVKRPKISFSHLLLWAITKGLARYPRLNDAFGEVDGKAVRIRRDSINIGLAVDLIKKDGQRLLLVPNIKDAQRLQFSEFIEKFDDLINRARNNKLQLDELSGTTVTLTNPGMIGTTHSAPRLMKGQGLIIASGSIDYPVEFQAVRPDTLAGMAVSKVLTLTSTYDHRIIQGAESAEFLAYLSSLLLGDKRFYDQIFASLGIPFEPVKWNIDKTHSQMLGLHNQLDDRIEKGAHVMQMINAYRVRGHLLASVNPLGLQGYYYPELDPAYYGFTIWDLDRIFHADDTWRQNNLPLRDIIELLRDTYCGSTGYEFMHIQEKNKKDWIKRKLELTQANKAKISDDDKKRIYKKLLDAEVFENYLHTKFVGHKRFSLEGSESVIVILEKLFEQAADNKLYSIMLGMAHRGRLNVLVNNIGKPAEHIFNEFDDKFDPTKYHGSGDVKYHLGDQGYYVSKNNNKISVILAPNPSHLELVDPIIVGMARAMTHEIKDETHTKSLPIIIHGDAAFAGQGIVAETLNMFELEGYKVGGSIHIVINNQIGFTTTVESSRSTVYATDIAKMIQAPILHVNGNDPEAVFEAAEFAYEYRNAFGSDVIIDIISYRKYGHNEADEPSYTQPLMYKKIEKMQPVRRVYEQILLKEKVLTPEESEGMKAEVKGKLDAVFEKREEKSHYKGYNHPAKKNQTFDILPTAVPKEVLEKITHAISHIPEDFRPHPKVKIAMRKRAEMVEKSAIDWATAEALAFGSLLLEGKEVRVSGEDSRRGTFSQRHAVLMDNITEDDYTPLNNIEKEQALLHIYDSPLSELAVLGFEYGYSIIASNSLTIWEAQFGDFVNMAQPIIDQFLAAAESKWGQTSNLTLLLPHSYEGQGPEHSSARLERFLQLCAEDNMIVANLSTPAQYFHALRRQTLMPVKMPLILMTPKSLLRHPRAISSIEELHSGSFKPVIDDAAAKPEDIKRIIFTTGKIYYELLAHKEKNEITNAALVRIEQFYPFDKDTISKILSKYGKASEFVWCQEEPKNMGAWQYLFFKFMDNFGDIRLRYEGRKESASTATGSYKIHLEEQSKIINNAFSGL